MAVGFNPTMVRLLPYFHQPDPCDFGRFNPTMVRLLLDHPTIHHPHTIVSIPQWCDCCLPAAKHPGGWDGFNPTMVRLLHMYQRVNNLRKLSFNPTMVRLLLLLPIEWSSS